MTLSEFEGLLGRDQLWSAVLGLLAAWSAELVLPTSTTRTFDLFGLIEAKFAIQLHMENKLTQWLPVGPWGLAFAVGVDSS
jgi:hypothetical protein